MITKKIDKYSNSGFEFLGCTCFITDKKVLLLNKENRTTMIVDSEIFDDISKYKFSKILKLKLSRKGFAKSKEINLPVASNIPPKGGYPTYFLVELTKKCNLHCKYCFKDFNLAKNQNKIDFYKLEKICDYIINFCKINNIVDISFQPWGGEPLICLDEIIFAKKKLENANLNVFCSVQTNGTLLTEETARILKENNIRVGVSIDGFESIQNYQRPYKNGRETFKDIVCGINNLKKHKVEFGFLSVITDNSVDKIKKIINHFVYDLGVTGLKFNLMRPNKNASEDIGVPLSKIVNFINRLFDTFIELIENGIKVTDCNIRNKLKNITMRYSGSTCKSMGCQGGISIISFDKDGNIYPCELTDHTDEIIGNIDDKLPLDMLIENARRTKKYFQNRKSKACKDCNFVSFCSGGCPAAVKYLNNSYDEIDQTECLINKTLYPKIIELLLTKPHVAEIFMENNVQFI